MACCDPVILGWNGSQDEQLVLFAFVFAAATDLLVFCASLASTFANWTVIANPILTPQRRGEFFMAQTSNRGQSFLPIALVGLVLLTPVFLLVMFGLGQTSGEEFSPDDFSRRSFSYNRVPYFKWTLIGKHYVDITPALEQTLVDDGFITAEKNNPQVWHLCRDSGTSFDEDKSPDCDASLLVAYLDLLNPDGDSLWDSWNEKYPASAKVFWPIVAELARNQMYLAMPDLMRIALSIDNDEPILFAEQLDLTAAAAYLDLAEIDQINGEFERAVKRLSRAIEIHPTSEAFLLRADAFQSLGKDEQANQDRVAAEMGN